MPGRWVSVAILVFWLAMTASLVIIDVIPRYRPGTAPSFRTMLPRAGADRPVYWTIINDQHQAIGRVKSQFKRETDHWASLMSQVHLDDIARISPLVRRGHAVPAEITSTFHSTPRGNLSSFDVQVRVGGQGPPALTIHGRTANDRLVVHITGLGLAVDQTVPYQPQSLVGDALSPPDRLPGLHVGQVWRSELMNPLTRQIEPVVSRVSGEEVITWHDEPVPTLVVTQRFGALKARSWVRRDGLVLRQQVPLLVTTLTLEREPAEAEPAKGRRR